MDERQLAAASRLATKLHSLVEETRNELLITRMGYEKTYEAILGAIAHTTARMLAVSTLDCDGTEASQSNEAVEEERRRRETIAVRLLAESYEEFRRRIYANRN